MKPSQVFLGLNWRKVIAILRDSTTVSDSHLYEWSAPHGKAEHISHDVVDDDHHDGNDEPDEPLEHVLDDQVALSHHAEKGYVGPGKKRELENG